MHKERLQLCSEGINRIVMNDLLTDRLWKFHRLILVFVYFLVEFCVF